MKHIAAILVGLLSLAATGAEPVREIEITSNPPDASTGQQLFTVRFTPDESLSYEKIAFDCILRQEFADESTHKGNGGKIHEPATFTYRRKDVKMVQDLDVYISFRVPVGHERLREIFGPTTFNTNHPVTVARMGITASNKQTSWTCEIPASGIHRPPFPTKPVPPPQPFRP